MNFVLSGSFDSWSIKISTNCKFRKLLAEPVISKAHFLNWFFSFFRIRNSEIWLYY